jgi:glutamyl-tRNA synthetase
MDWGNAIVRTKTVGESGEIVSVVMELHLEGDFRKTKKKITWLVAPTGSHQLVDVRLLDYDYLINKKKLEENDDVADFVTPVTEFKEEAHADANVKTLKEGDIIQFERKGYYRYDGCVDGVMEFIKIPDGRAANIASKAGASISPPTTSDSKQEFVAEAMTSMYKVDNIYGEELKFEVGTKMYTVQSTYT